MWRSPLNKKWHWKCLNPQHIFFLAILPNKSNVDDLATKTSQMYDIAINFCNIPHFPTNKRNIVWRQKSFENVSYLLFSCDFAPLYEELRDEAQTCLISLIRKSFYHEGYGPRTFSLSDFHNQYGNLLSRRKFFPLDRFSRWFRPYGEYDYLYFKMGTDIHRRSNRCVKKKAAVLIFDLIKIR